jgi:DNA replication and repair protein RecF
MAEREAWIASSAAAFASYHAGIAGGWTGRLAYEPALGGQAGRDEPGAPAVAVPGDATGDEPGEPAVAEPTAPNAEPGRVAHWVAQLRQAMRDNAERDRRRGSTQAGPHRDDLAIRAVVEASGEDRDLRAFGSGGQQRTAAIALRLVEADTLGERLGRDPIYLLDDVFAELDRERTERVVRLLDEGRSGQVLLTAPKPADIPLRGGGLARWRIREGVVFTDG